MKLQTQEKGQLLIEAMIATGIIVLGILGALALVSRSLSLNRVVSDQFTANYLAAEGIEVVKNLLDANTIQGREWNRGFGNGSFEVDYQSLNLEPDRNRPLLFDAVSGFYGYRSGRPSQFVRTINIEPIGADEIRVNALVKWKSRGSGAFEINLEDHFFNWRP